jgi:hypothetical protein
MWKALAGWMSRSGLGDARRTVLGEENKPYVSLQCTHIRRFAATASDTGELWLLVGTDSGFEGKTTLYYQRISVTLVPRIIDVS